MSVSIHKKGTDFAAYKKMIGGVRFYFGRDWGIERDTAAQKKTAVKIGELLEREHKALKTIDGGWTDDNRPNAINRVRSILGLTSIIPPTKASERPRTPQNSSENPSDLTTLSMEATVTAYYAAQDQRLATKKISEKRHQGIKRRVAMAVEAFPDRSISMQSIRRAEIEAACGHWLKRPISAKTGKQLSPIYVAFAIQSLGHFFRWAYNAERWDGVRGWETLFSVDQESLMTAEEKRKSKQQRPKFTVEELGILYANAPARTKLFILCALNMGSGQNEIATLRTWDLQLDAMPPRIDRDREKTGVQGQWELWNETKDAWKLARNPYSGFVKAADAPKYERPSANAIGDNSNEGIGEKDWASLALRTEDGYPLLHGQTDSISMAWTRLYKKVTIKAAVADGRLRKLGFYTLRHTAAQAIRDIAGYETHKVFLAHASLEVSGSQSVSEKHYTKRSQVDFDKVAVALRTYRGQLQPMFDAKPIEAVKEKRKAKDTAQKKPKNK